MEDSLFQVMVCTVFGPASYGALASAAEHDMRMAIAKGAPTLAAATNDAMKADEIAHNPQVARSLRGLFGVFLQVDGYVNGKGD